MPEPLLPTKRSVHECQCIFRLEQQMVRQQGFINRNAFVGKEDEAFKALEKEGYIELDAEEVNNLEKEQIDKYQLTHSCHLSDQLWTAVASLRRWYACDL